MIGRIFFGVLILFALVVPAGTVSAQAEGCDCFCRSNQGAYELGKRDDINGCRDACGAADGEEGRTGVRLLGCFGEGQQAAHPDRNKLCWTEELCVNDTAEVEDGSIQPSIWSGQEDVCPPDQGFCYNPPGAKASFGGSTKVDLGVPIAGLEQAGTIPEYVVAVYRFLIIAGSILGVVMLMVAGLMWATAAGNPVRIDKAKSLIGQSIFGLVLILSAVTIALIIDPSLTRFSFVGVAKVRPIDFIDDANNCDTLENHGKFRFEIIPATTPTVCGVRGVVDRIRDLDTNEILEEALGVEVGHECFYRTCATIPGKTDADKCMLIGEDQYECLRCNNIHPDNEFGVTPAPGVCGVFSVGGPPNETVPDSKAGLVRHECFFSADPRVVPGVSTEAGQALSQVGTCAIAWTICEDVSECPDYGTETYIASGGKEVAAYVPFASTILSFFEGGGDAADATLLDNGRKLQEICTENPCNLQGGCKYVQVDAETGSCVSN